jgi:hypothetical protein
MEMDARGTPSGVKDKINEMFEQVANGEREPGELKDELERWGIFNEYEDRFLNLFRK